MKTERSLYDQIYDRDNPRGLAYGWIQWKGTNVCIDTHCICGYHGHVDVDFFYAYECPKCQRKYAVGQNVKLIELTDAAEIEYRSGGSGFHSDIPDDDWEDEAGPDSPNPE